MDILALRYVGAMEFLPGRGPECLSCDVCPSLINTQGLRLGEAFPASLVV